jgi:hypothetical protein
MCVFNRTSMTQAFTLMCVITLLMVQAFGGVASYLCRCGGQPVLTQTDHCHGPHSESCHDEQSQPSDKAEQHAHENGNDTENHEPIRTSVQLGQASGFGLQAPVLVLVADLPTLSLRSLLKQDAYLTTLWRNASSTPLQGRIIGYSVVLLI